ncbi:MAG: hydrogenase subunit MbhD domain-containing protein [archaeon]
MMFEILNTLVLLLVIVSAVMAVRFKDLLGAAIAMAVMSLLISLEFYLLHAPDVAIAEAAIGAGLTTAVFVIAIKNTERFER